MLMFSLIHSIRLQQSGIFNRGKKIRIQTNLLNKTKMVGTRKQKKKKKIEKVKKWMDES